MPDFDGFDLLFVGVPAVLAIAGLVVVGSGVRSIVMARRFLKVAQQVSGTVSDHRYRVHRRHDSHSDHVVTVPVLRFTTRTGQRVEAEQPIALRKGAPERVSRSACSTTPSTRPVPRWWERRTGHGRRRLPHAVRRVLHTRRQQLPPPVDLRAGVLS
jgi:hypothetical protein